MFCTGRNAFGQLGDGTREDRLAPVEATGLDDVRAIAAGRDHTCALGGDGAVRCWGAAFDAQLGDSDRHRPDGYRLEKEPVAGLAGTTSLVAGSDHMCALRDEGSITCFGSNDSGQLGRGRAARAGLVELPAIPSPAALAVGSRFGCAANATSILCWGANAFGQLGDGTRTARPEPARVERLAGPVIALGAGVRHACAVLSDRTVACWGSNSRGQLGVPVGDEAHRDEPTLVPGLSAL